MIVYTFILYTPACRLYIYSIKLMYISVCNTHTHAAGGIFNFHGYKQMSLIDEL